MLTRKKRMGDYFVEAINALVPPYFETWHLPAVFVAGLIGEGYGTVMGSGGILIQLVLAALGLPLPSVVATDLAGAMGANVGVLSASPRSIWTNQRLMILLAVPALVGGIIGTFFLINLPVEIVKYIVIAGLILLLIRLLSTHHEPRQTVANIRIKRKQYPLIISVMSLLGIYGNVSGVGIGTFEKLAFMSILRVNFADSLGIGTIIGLPAMIFSFVVTAIAGLLAWPYVLALWLGTYLSSRAVTKYVQRIPDAYLRFVLVIVAVAYLGYLIISLM